jgi:beta-barrel assembly-enhancing protease
MTNAKLRRIRRALFAIAAGAALGVAAGCTINPVTGERQLALVSAQDEVAIGEEHYFPMRQAQGGDYVVDPSLGAYVARVGQRVAAVSDRALPYEFVVLNSSVPNAWALPGGKIAINRGLLLELDSEAELAAVLGHEIVHAAARHGALAMQRGMLLQGAVAATAIGTQRGNYSSLVIGAASIGAQLINQRHGRSAELESDLYGTRYMSAAGYDPSAAVSLQQTFVRLSEGRGNEGWLAGLFASHPPSTERVEQNRRTAAGLPAGGELERERYQAAIANLVAARPAYDLYDAGLAALAEGRHDEAERRANEALRLLPAEGHFHALAGDVAFARARYDDAIGHYRNALSRNERFFYYSLRKGLAHQRLRQWDAAEADLQASVSILPTADAYYGLGVIAEQRGDRAGALERYGLAAQSQSAAGQAARDAAVRLDLPQNPSQYLAVRTGLDGQGRLVIDVANPTGVNVADVRLAVRYTAADGGTRQAAQQIARVAAGGSQRVATGLGPFTSANAFAVTISSARVGD